MRLLFQFTQHAKVNTKIYVPNPMKRTLPGTLNENVVAVDTKYPKFLQIIAISVNLKNLIYSCMNFVTVLFLFCFMPRSPYMAVIPGAIESISAVERKGCLLHAVLVAEGTLVAFRGSIVARGPAYTKTSSRFYGETPILTTQSS